MRCVYCAVPGEFIVNDLPESVSCLEHLGASVDERMTTDDVGVVMVTRC
jgi:hypothetical protein